MKTEDGERVHIPKYGIEVKNSGVTSRKLRLPFPFQAKGRQEKKAFEIVCNYSKMKPTKKK